MHETSPLVLFTAYKKMALPLSPYSGILFILFYKVSYFPENNRDDDGRYHTGKNRQENQVHLYFTPYLCSMYHIICLLFVHSDGQSPPPRITANQSAMVSSSCCLPPDPPLFF